MSKISELSDGGSLVSSDYLIAVRSGGNVKVRMDQINVDQVDLGDNEFIRLGNSQDLTMVHTSTQSIINQAGIGDLLLQKAGATKLTINASGIDVTGAGTFSGSVALAGSSGGLLLNNSATADNTIQLITTGGTTYVGANGSAGNRFIGSSAYASTFGTTAANALELATNNTVRMTIASTGAATFSGSVTAAGLTVSNASGGNVASFTNTSDADLSINLTSGVSLITPSTGILAFGTSSTERMRIDSLGNASFNTTNTDPAGNNVFGTALLQYGGASMSRVNTAALSLNRASSDGAIAEFRKDGTAVGGIGANGDNLGIESVDVGLLFLSGSSQIVPTGGSFGVSDGTKDLGRSTTRFKDLYLSGAAHIGGNIIPTGGSATAGSIWKSGANLLISMDTGGLYINNSADTITALQLTDAGNLTVAGSISKGSGSFKIDHPLPEKSDTHHLVHSFVESPQADNIYRGKVDLVDGSATVNIDDAAGMTEGTYVLLNTNTQCFTSNESGWTAVRGSVSGNILTITAQDSCSDTISWMVVGERHDQHMLDIEWTDENGKVIVEPLKES